MANTTTITGNLTREPEIRYTREGQATAQLGVAVNRRWQDRTTQEWQESTSFFDVVCWRDLAENVALSLTKGMRVVVTGRLEHRTWETEDGEHRSKVEITADEVGASLRFATADVHKVERRGVATAENGEADRSRRWPSRPEWSPWLITTSGWPALDRPPGRRDGACRRRSGRRHGSVRRCARARRRAARKGSGPRSPGRPVHLIQVRRAPPSRVGWPGSGPGDGPLLTGGGPLGLIGQRERVDAVALPGVGGPIGEDMPQMTTAPGTQDLGARHAEAALPALNHRAGGTRPVEAGPARSGLELGGRCRRARRRTRRRRNTPSPSTCSSVTRPRWLGAGAAQDGVAVGGQEFLPLAGRSS